MTIGVVDGIENFQVDSDWIARRAECQDWMILECRARHRGSAAMTKATRVSLSTPPKVTAKNLPTTQCAVLFTVKSLW